MAYRSKRSLNNDSQNKDLNKTEAKIKNNPNDNENFYKDFKKRKYIIKIPKTPNTKKDTDKDLKTDNINLNTF